MKCDTLEPIVVYKMPFSKYRSLNGEDINRLYDEYVILGVYEQICFKGNLILVPKEEL